MKQLKKLTRREKVALSKLHLDAEKWGKVKDLSEQFIVIEHKDTHIRKTIDLWKG